MVVAFYFRLHLAYFPRPVVAIFARPEHGAEARLPRTARAFLLQARHGLVQSLYLFPLLKKEVSAHETYL